MPLAKASTQRCDPRCRQALLSHFSHLETRAPHRCAVNSRLNRGSPPDSPSDCPAMGKEKSTPFSTRSLHIKTQALELRGVSSSRKPCVKSDRDCVQWDRNPAQLSGNAADAKSVPSRPGKAIAMKVFSAGSELRSPLVGPKLLVSLATIALLAALLAVGGSASRGHDGRVRGWRLCLVIGRGDARDRRQVLPSPGRNGEQGAARSRAPLEVVPDMEVRLRIEKGLLLADFDQEGREGCHRRPARPRARWRRAAAVQEGRQLQVRGQDGVRLDRERFLGSARRLESRRGGPALRSGWPAPLSQARRRAPSGSTRP